MIRRLLRREKPEGFRRIPPHPSAWNLTFDMFDVERTDKEAAAARKLERLYHKGQKSAWEGHKVLEELVEKHGGVKMPERERDAIQKLFAVILWGELAAWKISTDLATHLQDMEPKMAATSQAHDEARHFYVMRDYLANLGAVPTSVGPATRRVLEGTLRANTLGKKLMGMQMMIEPLALTLFQTVRAKQIEPVLCELLVYYERDEARHVALGVLHLPKMLEGLGPLDALDLWGWQMREYSAQFGLLHELREAFEVLGVHPRDILALGREKQLLAGKLLVEELGYDLPVVELFRKMVDFRAELEFPAPGQSTRRRDRVRRALAALRTEAEELKGDLSQVAEAA